LFTLGGSILGLLLGSFLPIWIVWYFNEWEGLGMHVSLWTLRGEVSRTTAEVRIVGDDRNLITGAILVLLGALLGGIAWWLSRRFSYRAGPATGGIPGSGPQV
jgi:hypothetical protein